jgi:hypothetical protein
MPPKGIESAEALTVFEELRDSMDPGTLTTFTDSRRREIAFEWPARGQDSYLLRIDRDRGLIVAPEQPGVNR